MSQQPNCDDLEIRIQAGTNAGYPVEITLNEQRQLGRGLLKDGILPWVSGADPREDGGRLFDLLFADPKLRQAWGEARGGDRPCRLRLRIDAEAPELHAIPWELLREPGGTELAGWKATPFSRYLAVRGEPGSPIPGRPLKVLVAIAEPADLAQYGLSPVGAEEAWNALGRAVTGSDVELTRFPPAAQPCTLAALELELQKGYQILHFIGHGKYNRKLGKAVLFMADERNQVDLVSDTDLSMMLARQLAGMGDGSSDRLRMIFLASCETATRDTADAFRGFAPQLVAAGVPVVLAMQGPVGVQTAHEFAAGFYRHLLEHGQVDLAANEARSALLADKRPDAGIPVLFMRLKDGQLLGQDSVGVARQRLSEDPDYRFFASPSYLPMPVEAIHLTGKQDYASFDPIETEPTAGLDVVQAMEDIFREGPAPTRQSSGSPSPRLLVLMGEYGSNITIQLKRIVWHTLEEHRADTLLPVYVDLAKFSMWQTTARDPISELMVQCLMPKYWPDGAGEELVRRIRGDGLKLRVLFDHGDILTQEQREEAHRQVADFVHKHPWHEYVLAARPGAFDQKPFVGAGVELDILFMRRMERRKIRHFLQIPALQTWPWRDPRDKPVGRELLRRLDQSGFYDLAGIPWFMLKLLERAQLGVYVRSRTQALHEIIELAVEQVTAQMSGEGAQDTAAQGMAFQVKQSLRALAREMQFGLRATLPLDEAYAILRRVRGDREYSLEKLYRVLVKAQLLAPEGKDAMRFAYSRIQAYCSARAILLGREWEHELDDIVSSLGRPTRINWWEDTLVFACGMLAADSDKTEELDRFVEGIVYGMNLLDSLQLFLAARCLSEVDFQGARTGARKGQARSPGSTARSRRSSGALWNLTETVTTALITRLDNRNEPRTSHRSQAAMLLGQIAHPDGVAHLARTAYKRPFQDRHGRPDFDRSDVRMAAMIGLLRLSPPRRKQLLREINPVLVDLLDAWQRHDVAPLSKLLQIDKVNVQEPAAGNQSQNTTAKAEQTDAVSVQGLAALALGDIHMQLHTCDAKSVEAQQALDALADRFSSCDVEPATRWAVTYAIAMMDLPTVQDRALLPFFAPEKTMYTRGEHCVPCTRGEHCIPCYKCMAYLIGLVRWQDSRGRDYLLNHCMKETSDPTLAVVAIASLGRLADRQYKAALEEIALGHFDHRLPGLARRVAEATLDAQTQIYIRRKAIEALAGIGDAGTVNRLRSNRKDSESWNPELEQALYQTSEEIYWHSHRERKL